MEQLDNQPSNSEASHPQAAEELVKSMAQEIEHLRQNLVAHLSEDVERLNKEKYQLIEDIEQLESQRQQQLVQQQQLALQMVPTLVHQLQEVLIQRLNQSSVPSTLSDDNTNLSLKSAPNTEVSSGFPQTSPASVTQESADQLIVSLDTTLRATFKALQQDINSYQSSISQQLGQMYSLEQQGTVILEALVSRLRQEFQVESSVAENQGVTQQTVPEREQREQGDNRADLVGAKHLGDNSSNKSTVYSPNALPSGSLKTRPNISPLVEPVEAAPELTFAESSPTPASSKWKPRLGFSVLLLSLLALSLENVAVTVIFNKSSILGITELGGLITPSLSNSLLLLWLRMLLIVPLMGLLAHFLYPAAWGELKKLIQSPDWALCGSVVGSGFCLFLSQVLIYLALGTIAPGVAVTIFFIYPVAIAFWGLRGLGRYPNRIISGALLGILVGVVLSIFQSSVSGGLTAAVAGIAFAGHIILIQTSRGKLHPVPTRLIHSVIVFFFSTLGLLFTWNSDLVSDSLPGLIIGGVVLGGAALVSYLLNHVSQKLLPAATASIVGATVPVLTGFAALVLFNQTMSLPQILGMLLVSLGVAALNLKF
ncbi:MAG: DMT family transporter [Symploca sp. SIO1A3]|nr:DMT family transporter [Symploca sp. SIO1A3]